MTLIRSILGTSVLRLLSATLLPPSGTPGYLGRGVSTWNEAVADAARRVFCCNAVTDPITAAAASAARIALDLPEPWVVAQQRRHHLDRDALARSTVSRVATPRIGYSVALSAVVLISIVSALMRSDARPEEAERKLDSSPAVFHSRHCHCRHLDGRSSCPGGLHRWWPLARLWRACLCSSSFMDMPCAFWVHAKIRLRVVPQRCLQEASWLQSFVDARPRPRPHEVPPASFQFQQHVDGGSSVLWRCQCPRRCAPFHQQRLW